MSNNLLYCLGFFLPFTIQNKVNCPELQPLHQVEGWIWGTLQNSSSQNRFLSQFFIRHVIISRWRIKFSLWEQNLKVDIHLLNIYSFRNHLVKAKVHQGWDLKLSTFSLFSNSNVFVWSFLFCFVLFVYLLCFLTKEILL